MDLLPHSYTRGQSPAEEEEESRPRRKGIEQWMRKERKEGKETREGKRTKRRRREK